MKKLFLDLEGTLIESWHSPVFLSENIELIKFFIKAHKIKEATLFSMATTNSKECEEFNKFLKNEIESLLNIKLIVDPFESFIKVIVEKHGLITTSFRDSLDLFPLNIKEQVFIEFAKIMGNSGDTFFLFDDLVNNQQVEINNILISTIKV